MDRDDIYDAFYGGFRHHWKQLVYSSVSKHRLVTDETIEREMKAELVRLIDDVQKDRNRE
jgi:hypothetical protein